MKHPLDGMSDSEIARMTRKIADILLRDFGPDGKREEVGFAAGAATMLAALAVDSRSGQLTLRLSEFVRHGAAAGDWIITVRKDGVELASAGPAEEVKDPAELGDGRTITSLEFSRDLGTGEVTGIKRKGPLH